MLVTVEDGRALKVAGDPDHPFTSGFLCTKVANYEQRRTLRPIMTAHGWVRRARAAASPVLCCAGLIETRLHVIAHSPEGAKTILPTAIRHDGSC